VNPERDGDLNEWYDGTHIPELLAVPGFRSAAGETTPTDALQLDPPPIVGLYEELA
jgi:hypothetical protein